MKSVHEFEKDAPLIQSIARMRERGSVGGISPDRGTRNGLESQSSLHYMSKGMSSDGGF